MSEYTGWAVINDKEHVVPCMHGGQSLYHVAVWSSRELAERYSEYMGSINGHVEYSVVQVTIKELKK